MGVALRLLLDAFTRRAEVYGEHARARVGLAGALVAFALLAAGFLIALATVALAEWLGIKSALAIMAGIAALACGVIALMLRAETRAHARALARQRAAETRALQAAALAAAPSLSRGKGMLAAGAAGVAAAFLASRRRPRDKRD